MAVLFSYGTLQLGQFSWPRSDGISPGVPIH